MGGRPSDIFLDVGILREDYSKAKKIPGWEPSKLVEIIVKEDMERWKSWLDGKRFPWDAANYPSENRILSRLFHPTSSPEETLAEGSE